MSALSHPIRSLLSRASVFLWLVVAATILPVTPALAGEVVDLRDGVQTRLYGGRYSESPANGDFYGWAMAFGDIDGDGYTDFLSSSKNAEGPNDEHPGHESDVYLVFGGPRAEFDSIYAVDDPGGADIVFYMGGYSIACGDIDADGYDDLILAEITAQAGIHVIFGSPRDQLEPIYNFLRGHEDYTPPDIHITGTRFLGGGRIDGGNFDYVSRALVAGDVNGDGYADIIFGDIESSGPSGDRTRGGAVHIVFGRPRNDFPAVINVDSTSGLALPDVTIYGEHFDNYPFHLAMGDLDGDGTNDLIACTYRGGGEDNPSLHLGEIHGFWGKRDWAPTYDMQIETFDFGLTGRNWGDGMGYRVATGDLDGDGRDDLIAGTPFRGSIDRHKMGEYRIYFGRPRGLWPTWGDAFDMTDVLILGAETGEAFNSNGPQEWGIAFSFATGRRNDDPYDDLLIGAGHGDRPDDGGVEGSGSSAGKVYLFYGRPRGDWPAFIDLRDTYDLLFYGADALGSPGYQYDLLGATNGMADWDNDGLDELFLSAQFADGPDNFSQDCGEVYVFFSEDTLATPVTPTPQVARASLLPNVPNPFNPATTLRYEAPVGALVSLTVYDVRGREVARPLSPQPNLEPLGAVHWNAESLSSGVYFVKLRAGNEFHARKVHLVR